jgi:hypothetical protein
MNEYAAHYFQDPDEHGDSCPCEVCEPRCLECKERVEYGRVLCVGCRDEKRHQDLAAFVTSLAIGNNGGHQ